jgi:hypothetical protein
MQGEIHCIIIYIKSTSHNLALIIALPLYNSRNKELWYEIVKGFKHRNAIKLCRI